MSQVTKRPLAVTSTLPADADLDASAVDALVRRVQAGEREPFRALFLEFERSIRCYISAHASSAEMVDEVLQATFVACYENIHTYELRGTFSFWLRGIARNRLLKELRQRARHDHVGTDVLESTMAQMAAAQVSNANDATELELTHCLQQVTPRLRDLMHRRYVEQITVKQLAIELARTETWVSVSLHRTRTFLRECLQRTNRADTQAARP